MERKMLLAEWEFKVLVIRMLFLLVEAFAAQNVVDSAQMVKTSEQVSRWTNRTEIVVKEITNDKRR